ncbi:MFS transporter [Haloechinothrix sp. YIM 98757]|uniref:MFS transporter n=1 Tax=Haloechinothrix aidingensis TaxID=2752311 RepID=A0A838AAB1_9PSEU|nr:MFS transporter [Haloechinothrix aidingensis]MBA0126169.1 MFS transporter [Haloechinothrix aidingensis]
MASPTVPTTPASVRSWLVWGSAAMVYVLAVFHRSSFGVAGLEAVERFGIGPTALSVFTVLQLGVYATMQVPTGVLVDRFGPRRVLTAAALFLGTGQILVAVADTYVLALLARGVLGFGDALTFVSVLRLTASHFPARQYTLVAALTGALGFLGNLVATVPLALLLTGPGWMVTFLSVGALTLAYAAVVLWRVVDTRPEVAAQPAREPVSVRAIGRQIAGAWRVPGTRLGFWTHFSTMFAPNVLVLLWGVPYLVRAQGLSPTTASSMVMILVLGAMVGGPVVGAFIGRRPELRMVLVVGYLAGAGAAWAVLLSWPGTVPHAVVAVCFGFLSLGGPASMIGFALARDYNPMGRVGTATGVVNMGGFLATTIAALVIGLLLEWTGGSFRAAFLAVVVMLAVSTFRMWVWLVRARAAVLAAQARGDAVPVRLRRRSWDSRTAPGT